MSGGIVQLDARQEQFLSAVVETYTRTALPVGSRALARQPRIDISPASIRGIFAGLESAGFVSRPHASAGRVPTARGYRYYVDRLLPERSLAPAEQDAIRALSAATRRSDGATEIVRRFSSLVRQLTVALAESRGGEARVVFSGTRYIVEQPEFDRATCLAPIFALLDDGAALGQELARLGGGGPQIAVRIGAETGLRGIEACALVGIGTMREPLRAVAILGPTRLDYPGVVSRLQALRDTLTETH